MRYQMKFQHLTWAPRRHPPKPLTPTAPHPLHHLSYFFSHSSPSPPSLLSVTSFSSTLSSSLVLPFHVQCVLLCHCGHRLPSGASSLTPDQNKCLQGTFVEGLHKANCFPYQCQMLENARQCHIEKYLTIKNSFCRVNRSDTVQHSFMNNPLCVHHKNAVCVF